jgi:hypothetical protein
LLWSFGTKIAISLYTKESKGREFFLYGFNIAQAIAQKYNKVGYPLMRLDCLDDFRGCTV